MPRFSPAPLALAVLLLAGPPGRAQTASPVLPKATNATPPSALSSLTRPTGSTQFNKTFNTTVNDRFKQTSPLQDARFGMKSYERTYSQLMDKRAEGWRKIFENGKTSPWSTQANPYAAGDPKAPQTNPWTGKKAEITNFDVHQERKAAAGYNDAPIFNLFDKKTLNTDAHEAMSRTSFNDIKRREYSKPAIVNKQDLQAFGSQGGLRGPETVAPGNGFFDDAPKSSAIQPGAQSLPSSGVDRKPATPATPAAPAR